MKLCSIKKLNKLFSVILILLLVFQITASAEGPYLNYNYDAYNTKKTVPTVPGYLPDKFINGDSLNVGPLNKPTDFYYDNEKYLYVLDSGNSRILVLNKNYQLDHSISAKDKDGQTALAFQDARGIFVDEHRKIYVADAAAKLVYIFDSNGVLLNTIEAPSSDVLPSEGFDFIPIKVVVDSTGVIYVLSDGCYYGSLQYDTNLQFTGFFGSEAVDLTAEVVVKQLWAKILPKSMAKQLQRNLPSNYNNFDIDSKGFIYTCRYDPDAVDKQVRILNYYGNNKLGYKSSYSSRNYGDMEMYLDSKTGWQMTHLVDVDVDKNGFINVLDLTRGRVFQYDQESNLMFVFGGPTSQFGCFKTPAAVESIDGDILVLDVDRAAITVVKPTYFANQVHAAALLYRDGKYGESKDLWKEVLRYDSNYTLANVGLGKAYEANGDYKESLKNFKLANDKENYSDAYYHYRYDIMHKYFPVFMIGLLAIIIVPMVLSAVFRKRRKNDYQIELSTYRYPFYTMKHPFKGYSMLKDDKKGSVLTANIIVLLFFIVSIFVRQNTGFLFTTNRPEDFNILYTAAGTVGIFLIWVVSNWSLSTLMDGEGRFSEIWVFSAYALLPFVLLMIPLTLISNVIVLDEGAFFTIARTFIYAWVCICMLMAVREVHQFTMGKTILAILGTFLGMLIIAGIITIVYSMFTQLVGFIGTLINEITLRI